MNSPAHIVWHRAELRVHDQPALVAAQFAAKKSGGWVLPVVIIDDNIFQRPDLTPRRAAWFLENVRALRERYRQLGSNLMVRGGVPARVFEALHRELAEQGFPVASLHYVRNFTPYAGERDAAVERLLAPLGVAVYSTGGHYTCEPGQILTNDGGRYGVYSAYRRKWDLTEVEPLAPTPTRLGALPSTLDLGKIPTVKPDVELPPAGEAAALERLDWFLENGQLSYAAARDQPGLEAATSRLSYYLSLGVLSSRLAVRACKDSRWRGELAWRDFFCDVLDRRPDSLVAPYDMRWQHFPWRQDKADLERWQQGQTGYPMVDAGMRELLATGYMHNRVRMITASFFTKHLLLDWRVGEAWFRAQLLDGDRAQNVGGWQWCAGCGVDAAPYFRVFNPTGQGEKFDGQGHYIRRWIPELNDLPAKLIHTPWEAGLLRGSYPLPVVELAFGRDRFLETAKAHLKPPGPAALG